MVAVEIAGRRIGPGHQAFVIAEAGINHNGDLELARRLVDAVAGCGADAIKFQTFSSDRIALRHARKADYQIEQTAPGESQYDMLRRLELSQDAHRDLVRRCRRAGILFLSSAFDETSADFLTTLGVRAFKIPSGEITNVAFLAHVARKRKPMIVSTGMATLGEIETALTTIRAEENFEVVLLHCTSSYPAEPSDANLRAMHTMAAAFDVPIGYSDHTLGIEVALAAVALGASVIEKHVTLDRSQQGPDHRASIEPQDLAALVHGIRTVERAIGDGLKTPTPSEARIAAAVRKSLVTACSIAAGATLTDELIAAKRPGTGLPPTMRQHLIGRKVRRALPAGTPLTLAMVE